MGQFVVGVDTPKVVRDPAAIAIVELFDDWRTLNQSKDHAIREVVAVRALPGDLALEAVVSETADAVAALGPSVRVVYDAAGSDTVVRAFRDAYKAGRLASWPMPINVTTGDGISEQDGRWSIGQTELVRSLLEMVRTGGFTYPEDLEGVDDLIAEAVQMQGALTPSGKLQLTTRTHADRVTALGLALYPRIHPQHNGRRYYAPNFLDPFESYRAATAMLGQGAQDFGA